MDVAHCQNTLNTQDLTGKFLYKGKGIVFAVHTTKAQRWVKVYLHLFLTSALERDEW